MGGRYKHKEKQGYKERQEGEGDARGTPLSTPHVSTVYVTRERTPGETPLWGTPCMWARPAYTVWHALHILRHACTYCGARLAHTVGHALHMLWGTPCVYPKTS
jgi:hypothetical protein